jgi:formate/nitrite transporter FocA (FNT family)
VLSGTLLFTEANVEMPATLLSRRHRPVGVTSLRSAVFRLWILAAVGNMAGAFLLGQVIAYSHSYGPQFNELLAEITESKVRYQDVGGVEGYFQVILSGMIGNWLVGMAAFLATMGRTIIGKYTPVLVTVMAFVAGGFLHSPANMAYLSLSQPLGIGPGWGDGFVWAIVPAAIGNILGAFFLVALPFWITTTRRSQRSGA